MDLFPNLLLRNFCKRALFEASVDSTVHKKHTQWLQIYTTVRGAMKVHQVNMENGGVWLMSTSSLAGWLVCCEQPGGGASFIPREDTDTHRLPLLSV